MITEALQGYLLLGHQLARRFVHLGVVDTKAAEDGERLEDRHVRVREGETVVFVDELRDTDHRTLTIHDWHAEDAACRLRADLRIGNILVGLWYG